jgi:hypothetical protein
VPGEDLGLEAVASKGPDWTPPPSPPRSDTASPARVHELRDQAALLLSLHRQLPLDGVHLPAHAEAAERPARPMTKRQTREPARRAANGLSA